MHLDRIFRMPAAMLVGAIAVASIFAPHTASAAGVIAGFPNVYESVRHKACNAKSFCIINFDTIPTNRLLEATNVNCLVNSVGLAPENLVVLNVFDRPPAGANPTAIASFPVQNINPGSSTTVFALNEPIRLFLRSGDLATMSVSFSGTFDIFMNCTLSGTLLKSA